MASTKTTRTVQTIMDVFTASGGLAGSIFAAAAFLLSSYVENRYWSAIVRQTFVKEGIRLGAY